jgi:hypothetical protein
MKISQLRGVLVGAQTFSLSLFILEDEEEKIK